MEKSQSIQALCAAYKLLSFSIARTSFSSYSPPFAWMIFLGKIANTKNFQFFSENFFEKRSQNLNESPPNLSYPTGTDLSFPGLLPYFFSLFFILLTYNSFERRIVISPCADIYYDFCFHCEIKLGKRHISSYISYQQIIWIIILNKSTFWNIETIISTLTKLIYFRPALLQFS